MRRARLAAAALAAALLAGCTLAPKYTRPEAPVAQSWPDGAAVRPERGGPQAREGEGRASTPPSDLGWREVFGDARLQALVDLALRNNRDLRLAALNVELARAQFRIQRAELLPSVDGLARATRARTPADLTTSGRAVTSDSFSVGLGAAYELDLFGRVRSLRSAALETYLGTEEARRSAHLALVAEVATQYLAARALDDQIALARQTLEIVQSSFDLAQRTFKAGRTSELDVRTAESQVQTARFNLSAALEQRARAEHALVLLLGAPIPADLPPGQPLDAQALVAELPAGVPSEVLARRPDVLAAEHALQAANASIGAARAAFFPSISLTAFGGTSSSDLSGLFGGGSATWSFAPQIRLPIFQGGALRASLDVAEVRKSQEIARYERSIQQAFREVADALSARGALDEQLAAQTARVGAEKRRFELSEVRYRGGVDSYLTVLTAQRDLFGAQQQLIQSRLGRLTNLVDLYRALGGGWMERTATASR